MVGVLTISAERLRTTIGAPSWCRVSRSNTRSLSRATEIPQDWRSYGRTSGSGNRCRSIGSAAQNSSCSRRCLADSERAVTITIGLCKDRCRAAIRQGFAESRRTPLHLRRAGCPGAEGLPWKTFESSRNSGWLVMYSVRPDKLMNPQYQKG